MTQKSVTKNRYKNSNKLDESLNNREVIPSRQNIKKNYVSLSNINHQTPILKNSVSKTNQKQDYYYDYSLDQVSIKPFRGGSKNRKSMDNIVN
jgi:hypothetical protein